jgi:hypothetical protein
MDRNINIARATFAKDVDLEVSTNTTLLTFAGMGLAKCVFEGDYQTWVRTELLVELETMPTTPLDLTPFMIEVATEENVPHMTKSLRLIIADIVENGRQTRPEYAENITVDSTLLGLAGLGLVSSLEALDGKWIWVAKPELVDRFKMGGGVDSLAMRRRPEIRTDDVLMTVIKCFCKMARARSGRSLSKRVATISTLLSLESGGDAIAYKDDDGQLAWKASENLRRQFE